MAGDPLASYQSAARRCSFAMMLGFGATELAEQEFAEERVVAIPLAAAVERDQEEVRGLEVAQLGVGVRCSHDSVTEWGRELVEHRGAPQELLGGLGELGQGLPIEVVGDVAVIAGHRVEVASWLSFAIRAARYSPAGHPSVRAVTASASSGARATLACGEDVLGRRRVERQVAGSELERVTRGPQARQVRLLGTAGGDELGALGEGPRSPRRARRGRPASAARGGRPA